MSYTGDIIASSTNPSQYSQTNPEEGWCYFSDNVLQAFEVIQRQPRSVLRNTSEWDEVLEMATKNAKEQARTDYNNNQDAHFEVNVSPVSTTYRQGGITPQDPSQYIKISPKQD